jgi:hypothetical protein
MAISAGLGKGWVLGAQRLLAASGERMGELAGEGLARGPLSNFV